MTDECFLFGSFVNEVDEHESVRSLKLNEKIIKTYLTLKEKQHTHD